MENVKTETIRNQAEDRSEPFLFYCIHYYYSLKGDLNLKIESYSKEDDTEVVRKLFSF